MSGVFSTVLGIKTQRFLPRVADNMQRYPALLLSKDDKNHVQKSAALSLASECRSVLSGLRPFHSDHIVCICVAHKR